MTLRIFLTGPVIAFGLAYFSLQAWQATGWFETRWFEANLYQDNLVPRLAKLESRTQEMRERLEYMVFTKERNQTLRVLLDSLREQINLRPWSPELWLDYSISSAELNLPASERDWSFMTAVKLQRWNQYQRLWLTSRCVSQQVDITSQWRSICTEVLQHFPPQFSHVDWLKRVHVTPAELQRLFDLYQIAMPRRESP